MKIRILSLLVLASVVFITTKSVRAVGTDAGEDQTVRQIIRTEKRVEQQSQHIENGMDAKETRMIERLETPKILPSGKPMMEIRNRLLNWQTVSVVKTEGTVLSALTITVQDKDGKQYTVKTDEKTQLRRRFWGKIEFVSEFAPGDRLTVIGQWTDDAKTTVLARLIRNTSIQKRTGVFIGMVESKTDGSLVVATVNRGTLTVSGFASAKIINRVGKTIPAGDIVVGHRIRVRGLWDMTNNTLTDVAEIKDFSIPVPELKPTKAIPTTILTVSTAPVGASGVAQ